MWVVLDSENGKKPDVFEVAPSVSKKEAAQIAREETMRILSEYGIVYKDSKAEDLRKDFNFIRYFRKSFAVVSGVVLASLGGFIAKELWGSK